MNVRRAGAPISFRYYTRSTPHEFLHKFLGWFMVVVAEAGKSARCLLWSRSEKVYYSVCTNERSRTHLTAGRGLAVISPRYGLLQPVPHVVRADKYCRSKRLDRHSAGMMARSHAFRGGGETDRSKIHLTDFQQR